MSNWFQMNTAPKNKTILVLDRDGRIWEAKWDGNGFFGDVVSEPAGCQACVKTPGHVIHEGAWTDLPG